MKKNFWNMMMKIKQNLNEIKYYLLFILNIFNLPFYLINN